MTRRQRIFGVIEDSVSNLKTSECDSTPRSEEIRVRRADLEERRWLMPLHGVNVALNRLGLGERIEVYCDSRQMTEGTDQYDPEFITFEVRRK